ncbi:MAG: substrate-binding domain-containing protein [Acidobacteriaceae bacterium]|nr:substrate-binding domain-containing protein [Acidobacteriaceae bacterium]
MPPRMKVNYVGTRDEEVGALATKHLIEQGCTRLVHIRGPETPNSFRRMEGFQAVVESTGRSYSTQMVAIGGRDDAGGYLAMKKLLALEQPPDGVFCYNDPVAAGALRAILETKLRVPAGHRRDRRRQHSLFRLAAGTALHGRSGQFRYRRNSGENSHRVHGQQSAAPTRARSACAALDCSREQLQERMLDGIFASTVAGPTVRDGPGE